MTKFIYFYHSSYTWHFRVFGYGIACKNVKHSVLLFSERHKLVPHLFIFGYYFRLLKPLKS